MKRKFTLKGKILFQEVYNKGRRFSGTGVRIIVLKRGSLQLKNDLKTGTPPRNEPSDLKIGLAIGRKFGNAVKRNRAKRILRSICDLYLSEMKRGCYFIIQPNEDFKKLTYETVKGIMKELLEKAGIMQNGY